MMSLPVLLLPVFVYHVIGPPDAPSRPTVSKVATTSLKLKWIPPDFDGNSEITTYQVEQLQEGLNEWQPIIQQPKTTFVVKTLEPNTSYQFRITAYNDCGNSPPSEASLTVFTKPVTKGENVLYSTHRHKLFMTKISQRLHKVKCTFFEDETSQQHNIHTL